MNLLFHLLLLIRFVSPPFVFRYLHPFWAMIVNECVLDGIISPHHFFTNTIPKQIIGKHKLTYDIPLDSWGFFNALQPVLLTSNNHYHVFDRYRGILILLFAWRITGLILVYVLRSYKILAFFPNMFIALYLAVSFSHLTGVDIRSIITPFLLVFYLRELYIISLNPSV